ncbi:hypothetical protein E2C01_035752 [Portunus trituberculatus]|uniref:Uncharacterized protein n=1 Tax=Portunus trituberculatus TaxID=210409 RepID=A0A5B7FAK8_PORTR|nr:hypothetical protein [Portunus trituberculatus]
MRQRWVSYGSRRGRQGQGSKASRGGVQGEAVSLESRCWCYSGQCCDGRLGLCFMAGKEPDASLVAACLLPKYEIDTSWVDSVMRLLVVSVVATEKTDKLMG